MQDTHFIVREPLLSNQGRVFGYEFGWQHVLAERRRPHSEEILSLAPLLVDVLGGEGGQALLGELLVQIEVTPALLSNPTLALLPARGILLALRAEDVRDESDVAAIVAARARGWQISLRNVQQPEALDPALLKLLSFIELQVRAPEFVAAVQKVRTLGLSSLRILARGVDSWKVCDVCAGHSMFTAVGQLHLTPRPGPARKMNPAQALILQLMGMVRQNEDVRKIEEVIKRDPALSYKLLRYINATGFGLGCEIQSLRHAVTMLGYKPLYRWLALLLATSTTSGYSPVLMQSAVVRGRFAELLGAKLLPRNEAENLFVTGMFSLLDCLLGVPMEQLLEQLQLSEPVTQALLGREGIYGPFLAVVEACEVHSPQLDDVATTLCVGPGEINQAQLSALAWVQMLAL